MRPGRWIKELTTSSVSAFVGLMLVETRLDGDAPYYEGSSKQLQAIRFGCSITTFPWCHIT